MPRKQVVTLLDDFDGKELPEDTAPVTLTIERKTYNLYLSETNYGKLYDALGPFITDAETVTATAQTSSRGRAASASNTDKERNKRVRAWAQSTGFKYTGSDGEERTLGDRGQIPPAVMEAYKEANPDD